ncbi:MAG TPA: nitroreductase family protein [Synergistales bacterium]|nr:nitroreductase family protein [Synergistales bacterium]
MDNNTLKVILSRRSIRRYTDRPVEDTSIELLLRAGMSAPSAHNQQPPEFIVVDDRKTLDAIPLFHPYSRMLLKAPAAIVVCGVTGDIPAPQFWPQDCAAATENILLAAHALGIGSVWLGVFPHEELVSRLSELLAVPACITPFSIISLGYPDEEKGPSERYDAARVHRNRW